MAASTTTLRRSRFIAWKQPLIIIAVSGCDFLQTHFHAIVKKIKKEKKVAKCRKIFFFLCPAEFFVYMFVVLNFNKPILWTRH